MKKCSIKNSIVLIIFCSLFSCGSNKQSKIDTLPYYNEATFTPLWTSANSEGTENLHKIPAFNLTNQDGEKITAETFQNKIYVADFFFTSCPGICPRMTKNMNIVQEVFKDDDEVLLLSHSVTPKIDSVSVLKNYAQSHGVISGKWHLVTGRQNEIYNLGRKSYFVEEDLGLEKSDDEFLHTENFILVDKNRHLRGIYNGLDKTSIAQLIADIKTLKEEN